MFLLNEVVLLDRKMVEAVARCKGVALTAKQVALLTNLGILDVLGQYRNKTLKDHVACQGPSKPFTNEEDSSSVGTAKRAVIYDLPISPSSGMTESEAVSVASQRALQMFK